MGCVEESGARSCVRSLAECQKDGDSVDGARLSGGVLAPLPALHRTRAQCSCAPSRGSSRERNIRLTRQARPRRHVMCVRPQSGRLRMGISLANGKLAAVGGGGD